MLTINRIKQILNNHTKSYSNIIFWLENIELINDLVNIENGYLKKEWREAIYKDEVKILNEGFVFVNVPDNKIYTVEQLMEERMGVKNAPYFEKYFNRYVRTWYSTFMEGYRKKPEELEEWEKELESGTEEKTDIFNWYPVDIDTFLWISGLSNKDYNIDFLVQDAVLGKELVLDNYKIKALELDEIILLEAINEIPGKLEEYKKGKTNLINLFLGGYLKRVKDKNIDKAMLLTGIKNFIDNI